MPMSFPDHAAVIRAASMWDFREPMEGEEPDAYRAALADFVLPKDRVESMEIRTGKGWDQFTDAENLKMLRLR